MNKLLLIVILLLVGCEEIPKTFNVEFNSGKVYRVKSTGYYHDHTGFFIYFWDDSGMFPKDSIKSITVETYE